MSKCLQMFFLKLYVPRLDDSYPEVWTFRTQNLDDSYPMFLLYLWFIWYFRTQIVRVIQPVEGSMIRTHFLFISHTRFVFFVSISVRFIQPVEGWTIRTQCFFVVFFSFNFCISFDHFVPKIEKFISLLRVARFVPIFCSFPILGLDFSYPNL